eukprot:845573-Amphidinium_carterae.1
MGAPTIGLPVEPTENVCPMESWGPILGEEGSAKPSMKGLRTALPNRRLKLSSSTLCRQLFS